MKTLIVCLCALPFLLEFQKMREEINSLIEKCFNLQEEIDKLKGKDL